MGNRAKKSNQILFPFIQLGAMIPYYYGLHTMHSC